MGQNRPQNHIQPRMGDRISARGSYPGVCGPWNFLSIRKRPGKTPLKLRRRQHVDFMLLAGRGEHGHHMAGVKIDRRGQKIEIVPRGLFADRAQCHPLNPPAKSESDAGPGTGGSMIVGHKIAHRSAASMAMVAVIMYQAAMATP